MPQGQRGGDEHPAVGGENAAEMCVRLQRRDESVGAEGDYAGADLQQSAVLAYSLPDQPGTADLGHRCQYESRIDRVTLTDRP